MTPRLAIILAVLIAGCATRRDVPTVPYRVEVDAALDAQGIHYPDAHVIGISPRVLEERTLARTVVAHEVGHALGCAHTTEPGTLMYPAHGPGEAPVSGPTECEVQQARAAVPRRYVLWLPNPCPAPLREAAQWAGGVWNLALGRPAVSVASHPGIMRVAP